jgi:GDP-fucose protein O-fucosyltransferase
MKKKGVVQYLTFEPDEGGWNNIRMAMETVLAMAAAMGRTLVLPPEKEMYLLRTSSGKHGAQKNTFSFHDFFPMDAIHHEHIGLDIITMETFLQTEAMTGHMMDIATKRVSFPPANRTAWDGHDNIDQLFAWLRTVSLVDIWDPNKCLAVFPASRSAQDMRQLRDMEATVVQNPPKWQDYVGKPVPIDAPPLERLRENWAERKKLCLYDESMQEAKFVHFPVDHAVDARLLVHFYAFLFFQNWKQDLWMKRYDGLSRLRLYKCIACSMLTSLVA